MGVRGTFLSLSMVLYAGSASSEAKDWSQRASAEQQALRFLKDLPREWSGTSNRDCKDRKSVV